MAEGRDERLWNHTALLACKILEPYRNSEKHPKPFAIREFHPYLSAERAGDIRKARGPEPAAMPVSILKGLFCGNQPIPTIPRPPTPNP